MGSGYPEHQNPSFVRIAKAHTGTKKGSIS